MLKWKNNYTGSEAAFYSGSALAIEFYWWEIPSSSGITLSSLDVFPTDIF